jgi:hypothetical protein
MATIQLTTEDIEPIVRRVLDVADRFESDRISYRHQEAARVIGLTPELLDTYRREGRVPANKLGKYWMYQREDLIALVTTSDMARA